MARSGIGIDSHAFAEGRKLVLGGVEIPYEKGLQGFSDADVLAHAITDALLGAAGLGDIGQHFPDTDERWRGADSLELLRVVAARVGAIEHVDCTVMMERPKLSPHRDAIRANLEQLLGCTVNVKATTGEGMGFVGRGEGVAALAVATLRE
jgi:2-C-methyl-D-erythritol 2,4-cyclodiphosphate synthase